MSGRRETLHHVPHPETDPTVHLHLMLKSSELITGRQFTPNQQNRGFQKAAVGCQLCNRKAAIGELALLSIDVADRRLGGWNAIKAWT